MSSVPSKELTFDLSAQLAQLLLRGTVDLCQFGCILLPKFLLGLLHLQKKVAW